MTILTSENGKEYKRNYTGNVIILHAFAKPINSNETVVDTDDQIKGIPLENHVL